MDVSAVADKHLEIDGKRYYQWTPIISLAREQMRQGPGYRYWQAVYNILFTVGQADIPVVWPELFYERNEGLGMDEFSKRYTIEDDYIIPRDAGAFTPAYA